MADQPIAKPGGNAFLQRLDFRIDEFDDLARVHVDQVIVMIAFRVFIACATVAEFVLVQNSGLFEQFDRPVYGGKRDPRIDAGGADVKLFDIGMVVRCADHAGYNPALIGHPQAFGLAAGYDIRHWSGLRLILPVDSGFTGIRPILPALSKLSAHRLDLAGWRRKGGALVQGQGKTMRKDRLDGFGLAALIGVTLLLAVNQIIVKDVNRGIQPVFFAGLRSGLAIFFVAGWLWWRGRPVRLRRADILPGIAIGTIFAIEFMCLFIALDLTSVGRASVIFYSMPVWMAILAHFGLPGERITPIRAAGLLLAFLGTAWAILSRSPGGQSSTLGDLCALGGALGWAGTAFLARASRLRHAGPEMQLFWMVLVSAPILLLAAPLFGPLLREVEPIHWFWLVFQSSVVVAGGFVGWLWLLSVYPTSTVASFSFLTPIFAITLGYFVLGESFTPGLLAAAALVGAGIYLINRRA